MVPLHLSMISDRLEIVLGTFQSSITLGDRRRNGHGIASKAQVRRRLHRPCIQTMATKPSKNKWKIADLDRDSVSSIEVTDGSETLVSEDASHESYPYYALPSIPITFPLPPQPTYVFTGNRKIVPNIADFDCDTEEGTSDTDADSYEGTQVESSYLPSRTRPTWPAGHPTSNTALPSRELIECVTALSPPPLHNSGRARSEVVFIPRDSPGTCPIHGCGDCGLCDPTKPFIFTI
ncbi:hypothetical protein E4T56_gene5140 [Termitomyces sp. T112]|nr:hypothetical protein E4T56_gene5140 [Termitomyces sp. T112]